MKKTVLILTSDPDSINYEIIKKTLFFFKKKNKKNKYLFVGDVSKVFSYLNLKKFDLDYLDIKGSESNKKKYLKDCCEAAFDILKKKKAHGIINLPLDKKFLPNYYPGFTEYISNAFNSLGKETMLLYNEKFSVCPNTTHIPLSEVSKKLSKKTIQNNIFNINKFYKNIIGIRKPKLAITGLNPHNGMDFKKKLEEEKIIIPSIINIKKEVNIIGPLSPDSAFGEIEVKKINCLLGNYHDQVLPTFKYINKFNAINITLGLPFLRISPDHGTAKNIKNLNRANHQSFLYALNFFEKFYKKI